MNYIDKFEGLLHTYLCRYEGFTEIEANNEVYYIKTFIGIDKLKEGFDLKYGNRAYVFPDYPRRGNYKKLNRAKKVSIALLINKAIERAEDEVIVTHRRV